MNTTPPSAGPRAFTLLELLVTLVLVSALSLLVLGTLQPARSAALRAGQATVANLLVAARTHAVAAGRPARLLVNFEPTGGGRPPRCLRYLVLQVESDTGWQSVADAFLPDGVYVVPGKGAVPAGLFGGGAGAWRREDGEPLRSTALRESNAVVQAVNGTGVERWSNFPLSAAGTTAAAGDLILATGRARAPGEFGPGESPVELSDPEQVRGFSVSQYGVATAIDGRAGF